VGAGLPRCGESRRQCGPGQLGSGCGGRAYIPPLLIAEPTPGRGAWSTLQPHAGIQALRESCPLREAVGVHGAEAAFGGGRGDQVVGEGRAAAQTARGGMTALTRPGS